MSAAPQHLLLDALLLPLPQAADAWRTWRASTDLDHIDQASFYLLPALAGRMPDWLANDPQQAIFLGICRRAWSQNQVSKKLLTDALEILRNAGVERVAAIGPVLWGALYWPTGAIRPVRMIDFLVEPAVVRQAFEALLKAAWKLPNGIPDTSRSRFYFAPGVPVESPSGGQVRLHWRALPNTDFSLRRPMPLELAALQPGQIAPYAIPAEHSLIAALSGNYGDGMDWHCDALMICRQAGLDWERVADLLRWRSRARDRLDELRRGWGAEIPQAVTKAVWSSGVEWALASALRVYRRVRRSI
jgi:hypothetical protein